MSDIVYTDTITVQTLDSSITDTDPLFGIARFEVTAPLSAWLDHTDPGFEITDTGPQDRPLFYLPGPDPTLEGPRRYLLRGTLETLAETGWQAYTALREAGVEPQLARSALPLHFMLSRTVAATAVTLSRFLDRHRLYVPGTEIAVIAGGYAAHLAEAAPDSPLLRNP